MTDSNGNIVHNSLNSILLEGIVHQVEDDGDGEVVFKVEFYRYSDGVKVYMTMPCVVSGKLGQVLLEQRQKIKRNMNVRVVGSLTQYGMGSLRIRAEHIEYKPRPISTF